MFFRNRNDKDLPPAVLQRLRGMLFAAPVSTGAYIAGLAAMTAAFWIQTGDAVLTSLAAAALALNVLRVVMVAKRGSAAPHLGSLLALGCVFSALMSALVVRVFALGEVVAIAMAVVAAIGYLAGVLIRASAVPRIAVPHMLALFVPLIAAALSEPRFWPSAFLLVCFAVGCLDLSRAVYARMCDQLVAEHLLSISSVTDALTGIANRVAIDRDLTDRLAGSTATIALLDLDGFKGVNDTQGHDAGDEVLRETARRLSAALRGRHMAARLGGDEFAILFDEGTSLAEVSFIADAIVLMVSRPFDVGAAVRIGASVGLAASIDGDTTRSLKKRADQALYRAKAAGRGRALWCLDEAAQKAVLDKYIRDQRAA